MAGEIKEEIQGTVESVIYRNEANGYTILEVFAEQKKELVTVVGFFPFVAEGESVIVRGGWVHHNEYGRQFRADSFEKRIPEDADSILKYLSSGVIKGIGPKTAARIVDKYGADTFEVLSEHPDWIAEFKGISARRALEISEEIRRQMGFYKLFDFCKDYCSMTVALRIYQAYEDASVSVLRENPYRLCGRIEGVSFEIADRIAADCGYAKDGQARILGAVVQILKRACEEAGHSCLPVRRVIEQAADWLELAPSLIAEQVQSFVRSRELGYLHTEDGGLLYLNTYLAAEKKIAALLLRLEASCVRYDGADMEPLVYRVETESQITFAPAQRRAIFEAASRGVTIITGGPGTGKTTIIRALIRIYESMGCQIALAAPTGRAAKRMSAATAHEAKTVHRLLEVEYRSEDANTSVFQRNEHNLLEEDILIIDEVSMMDMFLFEALLSAVRPGARLVLLGDSDQLPSVGAGNVLRDLIDGGSLYTVRLTDVFRQGTESLIVTNAHRINRGEMPVIDVKDKDFFFIAREQADMLVATVVDVCVNRLPRTFGVSAFDQIQLLTPTRKGALGTEALNKLLQARLNPPSDGKQEHKFREAVFREGDKVMQVRNNYDLLWYENGAEHHGVYNGDVGTIRRIVDRQEYMMIDFDGREVKYDFKLLEDLEHAYAITVHKSQGSEYPIVVLPLTDFAPVLMTRNLLYTAVTRAKDMVVLIGRKEAMRRMVENDQVRVRYTGLKYFLEAKQPCGN